MSDRPTRALGAVHPIYPSYWIRLREKVTSLFDLTRQESARSNINQV